MGILRHRRRRRGSTHLSFLTAFTLMLFASASAASLTRLGGSAWLENPEESESLSGSLSGFVGRKLLVGPGSSPPTCRSKCGRCAPCRPVHVPIQPGISTPMEYYPEAWRCKCGGKLYMP